MMKVLPTLLIAAILSARPVRAQPEPGIAFKGGLNAATQAEMHRTNRYGFSGGISGGLSWSIGDRFSIAGMTELLYVPRGAEVVFNGEHAGQLREHYVDLVIAARPSMRIGPVSTYILLGGALNFLLSASKDDFAGAGQDITDDLHRVDISLLGGIGAAVQLPASELGPFHLGAVFLEARHDIGLLDVDAVNGGFKNRTSSLMLGLSFVLGAAPSAPASSAATTAAR